MGRHPLRRELIKLSAAQGKDDAFSLIVEGITSMCSTLHFQCVLDNVNDCDNPIEESESFPPTCSSWKVVQGSAGLIGARHISSP